MQWQGRTFPRSSEGDGDTPEALPARDGVLPHLHGDDVDRFPSAIACEALPDQDPEEEEGLEERGKSIGIRLGTACGEKLREDVSET